MATIRLSDKQFSIVGNLQKLVEAEEPNDRNEPPRPTSPSFATDLNSDLLIKATYSPLQRTGTLPRKREDSLWTKERSSSSTSSAGLHKRNENWNSLQNAVVGLFQKKRLQENELAPLLEKVRSLLNSKAGTFVYDYYQRQLLTKGMVILRENIRRKQDQELLMELSELWDYFYCYILSTLEAILSPLSLRFIQQTKGMTVRKSTLIGFRDIIVLKVNLANAIKEAQAVPPSIKQMLLIIQAADGALPPRKEQLKIESLLSTLVNPYLGYRGLYEGGEEPEVYADAICSRTDFVKGASGGRRLSRPLSVQTPQAATLHQLFHNAARKARLNSQK